MAELVEPAKPRFIGARLHYKLSGHTRQRRARPDRTRIDYAQRGQSPKPEAGDFEKLNKLRHYASETISILEMN